MSTKATERFMFVQPIVTHMRFEFAPVYQLADAESLAPSAIVTEAASVEAYAITADGAAEAQITVTLTPAEHERIQALFLEIAEAIQGDVVKARWPSDMVDGRFVKIESLSYPTRR